MKNNKIEKPNDRNSKIINFIIEVILKKWDINFEKLNNRFYENFIIEVPKKVHDKIYNNSQLIKFVLSTEKYNNYAIKSDNEKDKYLLEELNNIMPKTKSLKSFFEEKNTLNNINLLIVYIGYSSEVEIINAISETSKIKVNNKEKSKTNNKILVKFRKDKFLLLFFALCVILIIGFLYLNKNNTSNNETMVKSSKDIIQQNSTAHSKYLKGLIKNNFMNPIPNAVIVFNNKYKIQTNFQGVYTIKDKEIITKVLNNTEQNIYIYHKDYDTLFLVINKNLSLKNDSTFEVIELIQSKLENKNSVINNNINEINNNGNGNINIGNSYNVGN